MQEDKPKRPLSAYFLFVGKNREKVKAANPDFKSTEIVQELGSMWRTLPQTEKSLYEMEAAKAKADYVAKYGPTTKAAKAKVPKKPLSSYMIFSSEQRPTVVAANPGLKFGDIAKLLGQKWKAMSDAEKAPYKAKETQLKAEFEAKQELE